MINFHCIYSKLKIFYWTCGSRKGPMKWGLSVHPSFRPSFHLSRNFPKIVSLIFFKFWHGARNSYEVVLERDGFSGKIFFAYKMGKMGPKRAKNRAFSIYWKIWSLIFAEFDLKWKFTLFSGFLQKPHIRKKFCFWNMGQDFLSQSDCRIF